MAPMDIVADTAQVQRLALFFDKILTWPLHRTFPYMPDMERLSTELQYLAERGVVERCGVQIPPIISFGDGNGNSWSPFTEMVENCEVRIPFQAVSGIPSNAENEPEVDRIIRHVSGLLVYSEAPVAAHVAPLNITDDRAGTNTIELCIKNIPLPPENLPWDDFIQFRSEEENIQLLKKFRLWLQEQVSGDKSPKIIQEELESMIYEYAKYMDLMHKKHGSGVISTVFTTLADAATQLASLNLGEGLKALFDIRAHKIALTEAELNAPGREVSYIIKAKEFIEN